MFGSLPSYRRVVSRLIETGVLLDEGMIYFDARLSRNHPTVEVRVADVGDSERADAALGGEGGRARATGGGMVEDRVEGSRLLRPRVEVGEAEPPFA